MADFVRGIIGRPAFVQQTSRENQVFLPNPVLEDFPPPPPNFDSQIDELDGGFPETEETETNLILQAPDEKEWYHGRLDRYTSEERLREFTKLGSYLVRESDRRPGSYVLSFLGRTGINHFRITAVCGDFYIGGRQFDSLSDLIAYYSYVADLLKREKLQYPVPPPEPVNDKKRVVAILPYTKMPDTDELSFQKGDIFFVHNDLGDGWLWVTAHRTGEQGLVFQDLVEDLDATVDPNAVFNWFHPSLSKSEAVELLVKAGPGSFLVRPSDNSPGDYSLFFHINNQIQRFRVEKRGVRYFMGGRTFECLDAVIARYKNEQIVEGHTLGQPVVKSPSETDGQIPSREVKHAEKIYATLRECREQTGLKKIQGAKLQGYLSKKNDKNLKWKTMFFVLQNDHGEDRLYFYDNPKRTKPRGMIDLSCGYLYTVHESLWDKPHCFILIEKALPCLATATYLSAASMETSQEWQSALKPLCAPQVAKAPKVQKLRQLRCLHLTVLEAQRLPQRLVANPYCVIALGSAKVARTKVQPSSNPVWDEEFLLDDIPPDVLTLNVTVYNKAKRGKDTEVADLIIELNGLSNGDEVEEWYHLTGVTPVGEWGSLRLRTRYLHDLIMPPEEYLPLKDLLLEMNLEVVKSLADLCHLDRIPLATSLLRVFRHEKREADLLQNLMEQEIDREEETSTLFRAASLTTTLADLYMKSVCTPFLIAALSETIQRVLESKQACELNPSKIDPNADACANAEFLLQVLDQVTDCIFLSAEACPKIVRYICGCLRRRVAMKWPNERLVKTRVVSGFIFLRLICPALLNPRQFSLISDPPSLQGARSLVMIAKCLQNLANLVEFGSKEQHMEVVNPFILKNKERMIMFLDTLSTVNGKPEGEGLGSRGDIARDLGTLHHICVTHLRELQIRAKSSPTIKKLVTVTEMLTKHKQKYTEMIR
ncbi:ras GTPase-activating protein 1-like isoform X2 [Artemia franciscana]|uniref:Ras GTPase-activating protein 1 n=2 Tax=Artemia franciscana TaxID=6661 RepID=A0AA88HQ00_ARTSF|nr:hypothetical protein QYM36_013399 [Artemia franciscana]